MTLPHHLRQHRVSAGHTQGQVARWSGVTRQYVWQVEHGRRAPSPALVQVYIDRCRVGMVEAAALWRMLARVPRRGATAPAPPTPDDG